MHVHNYFTCPSCLQCDIGYISLSTFGNEIVEDKDIAFPMSPWLGWDFEPQYMDYSLVPSALTGCHSYSSLSVLSAIDTEISLNRVRINSI